MKREIKFRGKSSRRGEWLYGDLVRNVEGTFAVVPPFKMHLENDCKRYEVGEDTIGQFTGFLDMNGNEIYEGDIIDNCKNDIFVIMYAHGNLVLADREGNPWNICTPIGYALEYMDCNIIGNIHDNHELLKGGKE